MKIIKKNNYRVIVELKGISNFEYSTNADIERKNLQNKLLCEGIREGIKQHLDGIKQVYIKCDIEEKCSFCGDRWEANKEGCPRCCNKAIEEWKNSKSNRTKYKNSLEEVAAILHNRIHKEELTNKYSDK